MKVRFDGLRASDADADHGFKVTYGPAKRTAFRWRWYLMLLLVLSPITYFAWHLTTDRLLVEADGILTTEPISIAATHSGVVTQVMVKPGDHIDVDQILLDLSSPVTEARLRVLSSNLNELREFQGTVLLQVQGILDAYEGRLEQDNRQLEEFTRKYEELDERGLLLNSNDLQLLRDRRSLFAEIKNLEIDRQRAEAILYSNDIANAIRELEIDIAETQARQSQLDVRALTSGVVNRVFALNGEFVDVGDPLFEVSNLTEPVINVYLQPERMAHAVVGSAVTIKSPDGSRFDGVVKAPVQVTDTIPASLAAPFQGAKSAIKLVVGFREAPDRWIEGLPVRVSFPVRPDGSARKEDKP